MQDTPPRPEPPVSTPTPLVPGAGLPVREEDEVDMVASPPPEPKGKQGMGWACLS